MCSGKRGVHHGVQQVPALSARHTGGAGPQVPGSYGAAAGKEEQVEELRSSAATRPRRPPTSAPGPGLPSGAAADQRLTLTAARLEICVFAFVPHRPPEETLEFSRARAFVRRTEQK